MQVIDILKFIGEMGGRFRYDKLGLIMSYFSQMIADRRVIVIYDNSKPVAIACFSLTDEVVRYLKKDTWAYVPHNSSGRICCLEILISNGWNKEMRKKLESEIVKRYPQV